MNRHLLTGLLLLLLGTRAVLADAAGEFQQANRKLQAGDFAAAAAAYERILADEGPRAAVYYNLGNAYQNLKRYGPAILAYERARLLTPRDPDLLANLAAARKAAAAFEETGNHPALDAVIQHLSRNEWSWLVAGSSLVLGAASLLFGLTRPGARTLRRTMLITAIIAGVIILTGAAALYLRRDEAGRGIVLTDSAAVHLSPFEQAESLGTPGPGRTVMLRGKNNGFRYIEVPGANLRGWLSDKEVESVVPPKPE